MLERLVRKVDNNWALTSIEDFAAGLTRESTLLIIYSRRCCCRCAVRGIKQGSVVLFHNRPYRGRSKTRGESALLFCKANLTPPVC